MQKEVDAASTKVPVQILGVNGADLEVGNSSMTSGRTLPWLQDTTTANVWASWAVTYRDVFILNGENVPVAVYNLTEHDLSVSANYDTLKKMMIDAANAQ